MTGEQRNWISGRGQAVGIVELRDGCAAAAVAPEFGASLLWFTWEGRERPVEWMRPADATALATGDPSGMACFPLVPYSNRIRDGRFAFEGQTVQLPVSRPHDPHFEHGHGWHMPWAVDASDAASVTLRYRHEADDWPWAYEALQKIRLVAGALQIGISLRNLSTQSMPFGIGLHPYFPTDASTYIETVLDGMWQTDREVLPRRHVALNEKRQTISIAEAALDNVFTGWSRKARIVWACERRAMDIEADAPLDFLTLYTPPGERYFCAEPVSNATDAFNLAGAMRETGYRVLEPGARCSATVRFTPSVHM